MVALRAPELPGLAFRSASLPTRVGKHVSTAIDNYKVGDLDSALYEWNQAVRLDGDNALVLLGRALLLVNLGRFAEALQDLVLIQEANLSSDMRDDFYAAQAIALHALGRSKEAVAKLDFFFKQDDDVLLRELRREIVNETLRALVGAGFALWAGGKPQLPKKRIKLSSGPTIFEMIHEMRE